VAAPPTATATSDTNGDDDDEEDEWGGFETKASTTAAPAVLPSAPASTPTPSVAAAVVQANTAASDIRKDLKVMNSTNVFKRYLLTSIIDSFIIMSPNHNLGQCIGYVNNIWPNSNFASATIKYQWYSTILVQ
jgi:dihydrofolate reductase